MEDLKIQFKKLLIESFDNENEAARELAKETAIKLASNFTQEQMTKMLEEFSVEHIESRMYKG